jgi:hypothetical protein
MCGGAEMARIERQAGPAHWLAGGQSVAGGMGVVVSAGLPR